jgi:hypothetical protein
MQLLELERFQLLQSSLRILSQLQASFPPYLQVPFLGFVFFFFFFVGYYSIRIERVTWADGGAQEHFQVMATAIGEQMSFERDWQEFAAKHRSGRSHPTPLQLIGTASICDSRQ